ncbi:MAG TPA: HAD family hydrolase [Thermomicrobiaceae bacterium]|nr:HAD family hydrolase [Thermomicrobiaceae bacterium]
MAAQAGERLTARLVLFDLDDTLCDHYQSHRLRLRRAFGSALAEYPAVDLEALVEAAALQVGGTAHFAEVLRGAGVADPGCCQRAIDLYRADRFLGLELYGEALDVVRAVARHARVGMITNGPSAIQREKICLLGIGDLFPFILVSEEEDSWKPDSAIFARALELGGVGPEEAVYVGDSPEHDVAGAQAAGLQSVWVNRRGRAWPGGPPPDFEIGDLRELLPLLGVRESG